MRSRVFLKLMAGFLLVIAVTTAMLDFGVRREWERSLTQEITQSLTRKARLVAVRVQHEHDLPLGKLAAQEAAAADARVTVIGTSGRVLADSEADAVKMENHAERPEFKVALSGAVGSAVRTSKTVGIEFLYVAVPIPNGAVRLAYPLSSIKETSVQIRRKLLASTVWAVLAATLLALIFAYSAAGRLRRIVTFAERIAAGDFSARLKESNFDELALVTSALDRTAKMLEESFHAIELSRSQLQTLLESIPNIVMAVTPDMKLQWANKRLGEMLGVAARPGGPLVEVLRDPELLRAIKECLDRTEVRSAQGVHILPGKTFNITAAPLFGGGAVAVLQDITEIDRVEKTRRDFIANVSHELRTPLTSVQGYVETLLDGSHKDSERQFLEIIRKNAVRMSRLTEDLLTLARVESGEHKLSIQAVAVSELLNEAEEMLQGMARTHGIGLTIERTLSDHVMADRGAVQQVFANLIENAIKYSALGATVQFGAEKRESEVEFYVRDSGPGIPSEHQPRLFERFYRVDASRSRDSGGTGLGLAIVKHIILNHQGNVRVVSQLNHGSTFYFSLPLAEIKAPVI